MKERRDHRYVYIPVEQRDRFIKMYKDLDGFIGLSFYYKDMISIRCTGTEWKQIVKDLDLVKKKDHWQYRTRRKACA